MNKSFAVFLKEIGNTFIVLWSWTRYNGIGIKIVLKMWIYLEIILNEKNYIIKVIIVNSCFCPSCLSFTVTKLSLFIEFYWVIKESIRQSEPPAHSLIYSEDFYGACAPWKAVSSGDTRRNRTPPHLQRWSRAAVTWGLCWGWGESLKWIIAVGCPFAFWINPRDISF